MTTTPNLCGSSMDDALSRIDRFVEASMRAQVTPGLALAITSRDGLLATRNYGFANLDAKSPVTDETLFEFGSIGKTFTAVCALQLAEEGVIDLQAPVTAYLPWFAVRSDHEPITIHHLLSHTSGLPGGTDFSPDQRFEVWALREIDTEPPGVRGRYSNVGYKVLGLVLEAATGKPYRQIVDERILAPLGMTRSAAAITDELRHQLAVGYANFYGDRPWRPEHGFVPATWLETDTGDGCLAATAADLAIFLRMLLDGGAGPHGQLLSPSSHALLTTPHTELFPEVQYGYGLLMGEKDGRRWIGHGGSMIAFIASMIGDVESGIGVIVFANAIQETDPIAEFALQCIIAARAGKPLPALPEAPTVELSPYAGDYRDGASKISAEDADGTLVLVRDGERIALTPLGYPPEPDVFLSALPGLDLFPFTFHRDGEGRVEALTHGGNWYPVAWYDGPTEFETPEEWNAYSGHYRSNNPWTPGFRVVLRQGALRLIHPAGWESVLHPDGEAFYVDDDPEGPERFIFDTIVDGQALRVGSPGSETFYRFFTP